MPITCRFAISVKRFGGTFERKRLRDVRLQLPLGVPLAETRIASAKRSGSRRVNSPQNTPTIEQPFSSVRLSGIFGISPAAKPTTSRRPRQAIERSAGSVYGPPTGS